MATQLTPSMQGIIDYFEELGPRWGLKPKTCAAHALLYLTGAKLACEDVARFLDLDDDDARAAIDDLIEWRMVERGPDERVWTDSEPWDLLFAGMEERRHREIGPAMEAIGNAVQLATKDGTSRATVMRMNYLHELLKDLSAIGGQMDRLPSSALRRVVRLGGQVSKLIGKKPG